MRLDEKGRESETPVVQAEDLSDWGNAGFLRKGHVYPLCCEIEPCFLERPSASSSDVNVSP